MLEAEMRLPRGVTLPSLEDGYSYVKLFSIAGSKTLSHWNGDAQLDPAREEDGHWIVPGEVEFSTIKVADSRSSASSGDPVSAKALPDGSQKAPRKSRLPPSSIDHPAEM